MPIYSESPVLPVTQGLIQSAGGGACPAVSSIPPVSACQGRNSDCWSVGQADVDCVGNALCCFDGCANVCQGGGARTGIPRPQNNAREVSGDNEPQPSQSLQANSFQSPPNKVNGANSKKKTNSNRRPG